MLTSDPPRLPRYAHRPMLLDNHATGGAGAAGLPAECAGTAERDALVLNCNLLRLCGAKIPTAASQVARLPACAKRPN